MYAHMFVRLVERGGEKGREGNLNSRSAPKDKAVE